MQFILPIFSNGSQGEGAGTFFVLFLFWWKPVFAFLWSVFAFSPSFCCEMIGKNLHFRPGFSLWAKLFSNFFAFLFIFLIISFFWNQHIPKIIGFSPSPLQEQCEHSWYQFSDMFATLLSFLNYASISPANSWYQCLSFRFHSVPSCEGELKESLRRFFRFIGTIQILICRFRTGLI